MFPYFEIFGKTIGMYTVCVFVGFFVAICVCIKLAKPLGMSFEDVIITFLILLCGLLIGGHLLYGITHIDKVIALIKVGKFELKHLKVIFGGNVFYGGFIGSVIALSIYSKRKKAMAKKGFMDTYAVCVPLFHAFGRIGCFLGGCCYGVESDFGFIAPHNDLLPGFGGVRRFPISLVECVFNLLVFALLLYLYKKQKFSGKMIYVYMLIYPVGRFIFEFFRGDAIRGIYFGLSTSQWISIVLFIIGIIGVFGKKLFKKQTAGKI